MAASRRKSPNQRPRKSTDKSKGRTPPASRQGRNDKYHFLFHKARDAMFLADVRTRRLVDVNLAAVRLTGFSRSRLLTMKADQLHPESVRAATIRGFKRHASGSREEVESLVLTSRGKEVPVCIRTSLLTIEGRPHLLGIFRDVRRQRKEAERLRQSEARSRVLSHAALDLLQQADPLKRYNYLLDHAREITKSQYGFIGYIDPDRGYMVAPTMTTEIWDQCRMHDKDIVLREFGGLWGWVLTHKEPVLSNDPLHDPRHSRQPYGHIRIRTFLGVPCIWRGKVVGMVALANKKGGYTAEDRDLITDYSRLVTVAILDHRHLMEKKKAEEALEESRRLQENLLAIGRALPRCDTISQAWDAAAGPIVETLGARAASLYVPDAAGTHFRLAAGYGLSETYMQEIHEKNLPVTRKTLMGTAFLNKRPAFSSDIEKDPKFRSYRDLVRREGYRSVVAVPVIPEKTCTGVAVFYYESPRRFRKEEINLIHLAVRQLTPSLARITYDREMRESEERFRSLVENNLVGVYLIQDGIFQYVNPRLAWIFGYGQKDLIGKKGPLDLTAPPDRGLVEENVRKRVEGEADAIQYAFRGLRKNGTLFDVEVFGSRVMYRGRPAVVGTLLDVTERKHSQRELKDAHDRLIVVLDSLDAVVYATDMATHEILFLNRYARETFGDVVGKICWRSLQAGQSGPCDFCTNNKLLTADGRPAETYTWEFRNTVNGRWYYIRDRAITWVDGRLVRLEIATDITERRQLEAELSRAQRLEAAGRVAGQIAHDFNNLLSPLMAYPDLIRMECRDDRILPLVDQMQSVALQMSEINQQLLTLGRRGHYTLEAIRLDRLLRNLLDSVRLPSTVVLETDMKPDLLPIRGGAAQLNRVFTNLINNACEAMNDIGTLRIRMRNIYLDRPLRGYETVQRGEYVQVEMEDTGTGIDKADMDRIFEPFYSTKATDKKRGSGLGLSVVRTVLDDHGGYLSLRSRPGRGTTFSLFFPITRDRVADESESDSPVPRGSERVLIVDDDPVQREVLGRLLGELGYDVDSLKSGEEALSHVRERPCDLLVLDMVMEGIDGAETFRRVREVRPDQRALILSGYAESDRVVEAQRMGAGAFIRKPVTIQVLGRAVRAELDREKPV